MDRSVQVNNTSPSPTTLRDRRFKMKRHNTSAEINLSARDGLQSHQSPPFTLQRPKSLKLVYNNSENSLRIGHHQPAAPTFSELVLNQSNVREKYIPIASINNNYVKEKTYYRGASSVVSGQPVNLFQNRHLDRECSTSSGSLNKGCCRCCDVESGTRNYKKMMTVSGTPEGLSWRRLHMSRAKLKATATTSELLSGFAMVAMVELQINEPTNVPEWLFVIFAVCTTVLVAVHIFALMISTYILPNIDAVAKLEICEMVTESPHERMRGFIELAWAFSTVLGLFLFLVEVAILCWVKFWDYSFTAAIAATVIVIPVLITFILFAVHFYHSLVVHRCDTSIGDMEKLEHMKKHLDQVVASPTV